jgi:hypothetical protein
MKVVYKKLIYCLFSVMLVSCSQTQSSSELESSFLSLISANMNTFVRIYPENNRAVPFKYGSDISLIFENLSDQKLFFDTDNFVRLYVVRDSQWLEVRNKRTYSGELLLFPTGTPLLDNNSVKVRPALDNIPAIQNSDDFLRVVVVGEILRDDVRTGELVGAYVDVMIEQE